MARASTYYGLFIKVTLATFCGFIFVIDPLDAQAQSVNIDRIQHIHGVVADSVFPGALTLATHQGIFRASAGGDAVRVSTDTSDFMSLAVHPKDPKTLFASGHPAAGGNLGLLKSTDNGTSWEQIATGYAAEADFHILSVSVKNPDIIYGAFGTLHVSRDGGRSWNKGPALPEKIFSLSASSKSENTLFAGTMGGLFISQDGGKTWQLSHPEARPVTAVQVTGEGRIYAFMYGVGLMVAQETNSGKDLQWQLLSGAFQDRALLKLVLVPNNPDLMFAQAGTGQLMASVDGGRSWTTYVGYPRQNAKVINAGKVIFDDNCAACHGENGIGEAPDEPDAKDEFGFLAPALNDSAHAWHHPDAQLLETIRDGSPRNERMIAWKNELSDAEIKDAISYIKSLWSFRSLACQGAKHMACMQ